MPPTIFLSLAIIFSLLLSPSLSFPFLSTVSISHLSDTTIICGLITTSNYLTYNLTCTSFPARITESYMTDSSASYAAIAAGDGFLCAVGPTLTAMSNISTMRWWSFTNEYNGGSKRIYRGPPVRALSAGDSHVCGLITSSNGTGHIQCWRWPEVTIPQDVDFTDVAVGGDFVCGLVAISGRIRCFGDTKSKVAGLEPVGSYSKLAVGTRHACAISDARKLVCWGIGAPNVSETWLSKKFEIIYMALGEDRTCLLSGNGTVVCFGENSSLQEDLASMQFVSIQARRDTFCGVLMANYTLVCWGNKTALGSSYAVVFQHVLPGPCAPISTCKCGVWAGSGNVCSATAEAGICHPCNVELFNNISSSSSSNSDTGRGSRKVLYIIIGCVGGFIVLMAFLLLFLKMWIYRKSRSLDGQDSGRIHDDPSFARTNNGPTDPIGVLPRQPMIERRLSALISKGPSSTVEQFPLRVLQEVTNGFSESHKIGSGSFGLVYRAKLPDGRDVAIKRAVDSSCTSSAAALARRRDDRESAFIAELALLSRVNHKNLVRLYGFCIDRSERVLVYEFMENGTLYDHLHKTSESASPPIATWHCRLKLALDAARGIEYLHTYAVPPIIHRDIKSANILLDASWAAKVSDFGLSLLRLKDDDQTDQEPERTAGTVGYMDPEYYRLQNLTDKSDVYSFGVVLLELLSGCKAIIQACGESTTPRNIVDIVVPFITSDDIHHILDKRLPPPAPTEIEAVAFVGCLAADCVASAGRDRPTMSEVVCALERAVMACAEPVLSRSLTEQSD